ncbi:MAG: hypothetical protein M3R24_15955 [Chloroflexota bacterium]|nr:hypothetical protein [Chloroflexota bacterium]
MAQALFKSWFVDFDPVLANRNGERLAGLAPEVQALFPSEFEESELGLVPAGWRVDKMSTICSTQYGYTQSASEQPIGPKFLRITDMNKEPWIDWANVPYCKTDAKTWAQYQLKMGDVVVSRMADPGKAGIVEEQLDAVFASYLIRLVTDGPLC